MNIQLKKGRGRPVKIKPTPEKQGNLLELIAQHEEVREHFKALFAVKRPDDLWKGVLCVPPASHINYILNEYEKESDIPLEIPFFQYLHILAGTLLQAGVTIQVKQDVVCYPDIWTILLAPSGSGKTTSLNALLKMAGQDCTFDLAGLQSAAAFFQSLYTRNNYKLAIRDEFNEFYKAIKNASPDSAFGGIKDILLRAYDNATISHETKKEGYKEIEKVVISILGMTVDKSLLSTMDFDDLCNGFFQRLPIVLAQKDPKRPMVDFPIYDLRSSRWAGGWQRMIETIKHKQYIVGSNALDGYITAFRTLIDYQLDESFYRRTLWRAHKYALLYHIICGYGEKQEITEHAYGWAARVVHMQLCDTKQMLAAYNISNLERVIASVERVVLNFAADGKEATARDIIQHVKAIKNVGQVRAIMSLINEDDLRRKKERTKLGI